MVDRYAPTGLSDPAADCYAITPDDANDLPEEVRYFSVTTSGHISITTRRGRRSRIYVEAGAVFPQRAKKVWATDTDALEIVGHT